MEELVDELCDVVNQATRMNDGTLDSMAISANASGMRLLARLGKLTIDREYGRRVIAHWPEQANEKLTGGDLLASLAAIYRHSGKFSVRYWRLVPKCHLAATLKAIHDEAGRHMPAIKQIKANKEVRGSE